MEENTNISFNYEEDYEEHNFIKDAFLTIKKDKVKYNSIYRVYFNNEAIKLFPDYTFIFKQDFNSKIVSVREPYFNESYNVRTISKALTLSTINIDQNIPDGRYYLDKIEDSDWLELILIPDDEK